jgi:hypothetical protein
MASRRKVKGELLQYERPDWKPLTNALLGWFMWMHVTNDETAFEYSADDRYREVELDVAILRVFEPWRPLECPTSGA